MNTQMNIRLEESLKQKLDELARSSGKSSSEVVRELISDYVKDRDIGQYIDELWGRIGNQLREEGFDSEDVSSVIEQVRDESL
jgi:predicted transcriptional regulator